MPNSYNPAVASALVCTAGLTSLPTSSPHLPKLPSSIICEKHRRKKRVDHAFFPQAKTAPKSGFFRGIGRGLYALLTRFIPGLISPLHRGINPIVVLSVPGFTLTDRSG